MKDLARSSARSNGEPELLRLHHEQQVGSALYQLDNDLERCVLKHKQGLIEGFTKKYRVTRLVYAEEFQGPSEMVARERQLKGWSRTRKLELIHMMNPEMIYYARRTARDPSTPAASTQDDARRVSKR